MEFNDAYMSDDDVDICPDTNSVITDSQPEIIIFRITINVTFARTSKLIPFMTFEPERVIIILLLLLLLLLGHINNVEIIEWHCHE